MKAAHFLRLPLILILFFTPLVQAQNGPHQLEYLQRGLIAVPVSDSEIFLSWRFLVNDPDDARFNVYRSTDGGPYIQINGDPIADSTNFVDHKADLQSDNSYYVRLLSESMGDGLPSEPFMVAAGTELRQYFDIPMQKPANSTVMGEAYSYSANDCSVADLDGDGEYEIVVKWDPSNSKDNSFDGYAGNVILDGYEMDGTHMWRIDLGINIRAGAHYTQFMVYDLDGDGKAEVACKTADGTRFNTTPGDSLGWQSLAGTSPGADYRNSAGYILDGPEYLTVFNGETGAELETVDYYPPRGNVGDWGDNYGNRVDRFLACVAYLDGERPSLVMCRGYYTRTVLAAYDWRDGQLTQRWIFDTDLNGLTDYMGQGAHSLTVGDVDDDGKDEIVYGACTIDDDGSGLYSTLIGHGDALHMSDMDPNRPGKEVWMVHESPATYEAQGDAGSEAHDAGTGASIYKISGEGADVGRGVAADIDPNYPGFETWASRGGLSSFGADPGSPTVTSNRPGTMNFAIFWDADLGREMLDGVRISKWNVENEVLDTLMQGVGVLSNNGTKATPCLSADLFGDWREEVIWRDTESNNLRVYTTVIPTHHRVRTLMQDRQYRLAIAWQNTGYNQPPHPGFYLGYETDTAAIPVPDYYFSKPELVPASGMERLQAWLVNNGFPAETQPDFEPYGDGRTILDLYAFDNYGNLVSAYPGEGEGTVMAVNAPRQDIDYAVASSEDLSAWQNEGIMVGGVPMEWDLPQATNSRFVHLARVSDEDYNALPQVEIIVPVTGQDVGLGEVLNLEATASDPDSAIDQVEFLINGQSVGADPTAPYSLGWTATAAGEFEVRAIATDDRGATGFSPRVHFSVVDIPTGTPVTYQVEDDPNVDLFGGVINDVDDPQFLERNFNGTGYVNFPASGGIVAINNVDGGGGGRALMIFRYALGAESRFANIYVNFNIIYQNLEFPSTGTWRFLDENTLEIEIDLEAGATNTLYIEAAGGDMANIDEITIIPSP